MNTLEAVLTVLVLVQAGAIAYLVATRQKPTAAPKLEAKAQPSRLRGTFERYSLGKPIAQGASAEIYEARDDVDGGTVALKILRSQGRTVTNAETRFLQEAKVLQRAGQVAPRGTVVEVLRHGRDVTSGRPFIALELVPGLSLTGLMSLGLRPGLEETGQILAPVAAALDAVCEIDITHGDVSPDNILVEREGEAWGRVTLIDFGMAQHEYRPADAMDGGLFGKPTYMSPEVCRGQQATPLSDVYSLGVIAYQMLSGQPPFRSSGSNPVEVMQKHMEAPVPELPGDFPEPLRAGLAAALAKDPAQRPPTAGEIIKLIRWAVRGCPGTGPTWLTEAPPPVVAAEPSEGPVVDMPEPPRVIPEEELAPTATEPVVADKAPLEEPAVIFSPPPSPEPAPLIVPAEPCPQCCRPLPEALDQCPFCRHQPSHQESA